MTCIFIQNKWFNRYQKIFSKQLEYAIDVKKNEQVKINELYVFVKNNKNHYS